MASVSPKHDTHPLIEASGRFSVSILAGDQVERRAVLLVPRPPVPLLGPRVPRDGRRPAGGARCHRLAAMRGVRPGAVARRGRHGRPGEDLDHDLFFARVTATGEGRLGEPPLLYSSRQGWRIAGDKAREPGTSIRDRLLARVDGRAGADARHRTPSTDRRMSDRC